MKALIDVAIFLSLIQANQQINTTTNTNTNTIEQNNISGRHNRNRQLHHRHISK